MPRVSSKRALALAGLCTALALVFCRHVFVEFDNWGIHDWDQHLFFREVQRKSIVEYGQFPLWNPYYCGGMVMLANPQSSVLSPSFLLDLAFGTVRGVKLEIVFHVVLGMLGMCYLYPLMPGGRGGVCAFAAASVFMLNSMYSAALATGMTWFLAAAYLPWALAFYVRGHDRLAWGAASGAALALMFFAGGVYLVAITGLLLVVLAALAVCRSTLKRRLLVLVIVFGFAAGFSAVKLVPSMAYQWLLPREVDDYSGYSLQTLAYGLLGRDQTIDAIQRFRQEPGFLAGVSYQMDENAAYVGWLGLGLALCGAAFRWRQNWRVVVCACVFLWLSFGDRAPLSLWELLRCLPVFDAMRVAQRFRVPLVLCLALLAGDGLLALAGRMRGRWGERPAGIAAAALAALLVADLVWVNSATFAEAFPLLPRPVVKQGEFQQIETLPTYSRTRYLPLGYKRRHASWGGMYPAVLSNLGTIYGDESSTTVRAAVPRTSGRYRGEAYIEEGSGRVTISKWTPNRIELTVEASAPCRVVLNQNYLPGWHADSQRMLTVEPYMGLLSARITPADKAVVFRYFPLSFSIGLAITCASLVAAAVFGREAARREAATRTLCRRASVVL